MILKPPHICVRRMAIVLCAVRTPTRIASGELSETNRARFAVHAQKVLAEAQKRHEQSPTNSIAAWSLASAFFDRAEFSTNDTERATLAEQGIEVSRKALKRDPRSGPLHYYLGLNLGNWREPSHSELCGYCRKWRANSKLLLRRTKKFSQARRIAL
jgi:hypothetical protein